MPMTEPMPEHNNGDVVTEAPLPCPFCGGAGFCEPPALACDWHGYCAECGASGPDCNSSVEAIAAWNERALATLQVTDLVEPKPDAPRPTGDVAEAWPFYDYEKVALAIENALPSYVVISPSQLNRLGVAATDRIASLRSSHPHHAALVERVREARKLIGVGADFLPEDERRARMNKAWAILGVGLAVLNKDAGDGK